MAGSCGLVGVNGGESFVGHVNIALPKLCQFCIRMSCVETGLTLVLSQKDARNKVWCRFL